jgi:hypothetical protein
VFERATMGVNGMRRDCVSKAVRQSGSSCRVHGSEGGPQGPLERFGDLECVEATGVINKSHEVHCFLSFWCVMRETGQLTKTGMP